MRIVHVLAPSHAGGLERVVHALAIGQQRGGHDVVTVPIVEGWTATHSFAAPLARADVAIRPIDVPARAYRRERSEMAAILRDLAPDVMHTHGYHADVVDGGVARRLRIPTVSTAHGFTRGEWRNRFYESLNRRALRKFDAVVAVSGPLANELVRTGVPSDRVHVIPNAWSRIVPTLDRESARMELSLHNDAFVIGWVGRMTPEKGLDVFVDALAQLMDLPIEVFVMGEGPDRARNEERARSTGFGDRMHWAGLVREAGQYFNAFDLVVLSSRTEGVPMVALEAMAAGVPLVVTAVGGLPDVVSPEEALLVPSERPDLLASAIRYIFAERASALRRSVSALKRLERQFAEGPWLARYEGVYDAARTQASRRA